MANHTKALVKKIHWNCYHKCNMQCDFCYTWNESKPSLNTNEAKKLLKNVRELFNNDLVFTFGGGDPLLRDDILELIRYSHDVLNFRIELQTNAQKLTKAILDDLIPYVDYFGFSIDGEDSDTHYKMRGSKYNFQHIFDLIENLDQLKMQGFNFDTTIRTLVSNKNKNHVKFLLDLLIKHPSVTKWSLRQFCPLERGYNSKVVHEVDELEFQNLIDEILVYAKLLDKTLIHKSTKLKITKIDLTDMQNCYCLIAPNGDVYYHPEEGEQYRSIGNLLFDDNRRIHKNILVKCEQRQIREKRESFILRKQF